MKQITLILIFFGISAGSCFGQLRITIMNVGQGNGAVIQSPSGNTVVYDAGPSTATGNNILSFVRDTLGLHHIQYTFVSHYHADHIGGLDDFIDSLSRDSVLGGCWDRGGSYASATYDDYVTAAGTKRITDTLGKVFDLGSGVAFRCVCMNGQIWNDGSITPGSEENNNSMGMLITYGNFKMIMATDIAGYNSGSYKDIESHLAPIIGPVSVMLVNHHGSATSTDTAWVDSLRPKAAIISCGNNNTFGHPTQAAIDRICGLSTAYIYQTQTNTDPTAGTIPAGRGRCVNANIHIVVGDTSFTVAGDHYSLQAMGVASMSNEARWPFIVASPYPNPSKSTSTISYQLSRATSVNISLYNVAGQLIKNLYQGTVQPGHHNVRWDGQDNEGRNVSNGVYFYRVLAGPYHAYKKVTLIR